MRPINNSKNKLTNIIYAKRMLNIVRFTGFFFSKSAMTLILLKKKKQKKKKQQQQQLYIYISKKSIHNHNGFVHIS